MDGTHAASREAATIDTPPCTKAAFAASSNGGPCAADTRGC
jgi:hypothetical protein